MEKEEILAISRRENKNRDLAEAATAQQAGNIAGRVGACVCCLVSVVFVWATGTMLYSHLFQHSRHAQSGDIPKKEKENGAYTHYFVFCHVSPVPCSFRCTARWSARMNDELKLRNRLKDARTEKALSQAQLAEMVGVSRNTISSIETGQFNPTAKLALVLCIALDKKFEELFYF